MAATNPLRVSDLIAKYGWQIMVYLSNLGPTLLAEAQILFVDSGNTANKLDADDGVHGHSFMNPLATIDYAIDLCTAGERSVIFAAPGHNEGLDGTSIDFDVSDITVIGIGEGTNRPTIDFDSTDAIVSIGANNIHLVNLRFRPSIDDIVIGVDVEAGKTGTILEKCEWAEMEDTGDEFILGLDIKAGCTDTKVTNCLFRTELTGDGCTHAIKLTGASDNVIIEKSRFIGNWSTAAIGGDTTLSTDVLIDDVTIKVTDGEPGIEMLTGTTGIIRNACIESTGATIDNMIVADTMSWFNNWGVTADGEAAEIIGGSEVNAQIVAHGLDHLVTLADGTDAYPASVVQDSILAKILSKDEPPVTTSFDNTTDSLEAIADKIGASGGGIAYFVDNDSGSNSNDGLGWDTAKADIDHAIGSVNGVVSNYDTVYVRGTATYEESVATGTEVGVKIIGVGDGKLNPLWTSAAVGEVALTLNGQGWEVRNFLFHGGSKTASMIQVTLAGGGSVIENNYFHGGASSLSAVQYTGGSLQNKLIGNFITQFGATHGDSGNNYEAAVWGNSYNQSACDYEIRDNNFSDNTDHLKLQAVNCLIRGNTFYHDGYNDDTTVVIDLYCSNRVGSNGNNIVVDNYFSHDSSKLTPTNGYKFRDNDYLSGNHCPNDNISSYESNPNSAFGKVYWVDAATGDDTYNTGLSPEQAFASIGTAITASNLTCGNYNMNTIYVNAGTYTEDLTTEPKNVNIIGIGAKTRLQGTHAFSTANSQNWHWYNMQFRDTSGVNFTVTNLHHACGWHGCTFENSGSATGALSLGTGFDYTVENCKFLGNPVFTTAIQITGNQYRTSIKNNLIAATTTGILIDAASVGYGNMIEGNIIGRTMTDPNSSAQMTRGISSLKSDGHSGFMVVENRIEAVDAIYFAHTSGTNETDCCLGNICSEAGTGSSEVLIPAV